MPFLTARFLHPSWFGTEDPLSWAAVRFVNYPDHRTKILVFLQIRHLLNLRLPLKIMSDLVTYQSHFTRLDPALSGMLFCGISGEAGGGAERDLLKHV